MRGESLLVCWCASLTNVRVPLNLWQRIFRSSKKTRRHRQRKLQTPHNLVKPIAFISRWTRCSAWSRREDYAFHSNDKFQLCFGFLLRVSLLFESTSRVLLMQINQSPRDYQITGWWESQCTADRRISSRATKKFHFSVFRKKISDTPALAEAEVILDSYWIKQLSKYFFCFFRCASLQNTLSTRMHHLAKELSSFPWMMKQSHSRNSNQALELWIFFSLAFCFVMKFLCSKLLTNWFFLLWRANYMDWLFIQLFMATFKILARLSEAPPSTGWSDQAVKVDGEWISSEFRSKFPRRPADFCV